MVYTVNGLRRRYGFPPQDDIVYIGGTTMNWKIVLSLLLAFMLVFSVFAGCTQQRDEAVEDVRKQLW